MSEKLRLEAVMAPVKMSISHDIPYYFQYFRFFAGIRPAVGITRYIVTI